MLKRISRLIVLAALLMTTAVAFVGCGDPSSLKEPTGLSYDGQAIVWSAVKNADHYMMKINDSAEIKVSSTTFIYDGAEKQFTVQLKAVPKSAKIKMYTDSGWTTVMFRPLATITNIDVDQDGLISWSPVTNATGYRISINNEDIGEIVSDTRYQLPAGNNSVMVRAISTSDSTLYSKWSAVKMVRIYAPPANVSYDSEFISWDAVSGASYIVKVNDEEIAVPAGQTKLAYTSDAAKITISVKAVGDGTTYLSSQFSTEISYNYLPPIRTVKFENGVLVWDEVEGAKHYRIRFTRDGVVREALTLDQPRYDGVELVSGHLLNVQVLAVPETPNTFSVWSKAITIRLLSAPVNVLASVNDQNIVVSWQPYTSEGELIDGYDIIVESTISGFATKVESTSNTSFSFPAGDAMFQQVGTYTMSIVAKPILGDGFAYSASVRSTAITVTRLAQVTSLTSTHDKFSTSDVVISWGAVSGASSYRLTPSDSASIMENGLSRSYAIDGNSLAKEVIFTVTAVGRTTESEAIFLDGAPSAEYKVTKLATPTKPIMSAFEVEWSQVVGATGYRMYAAGQTIDVDRFSGVPLAFPGLTAATYDLKVRAIGNGTNIISSDASEGMEFTKLAAPTFLTVSFGGVLSWDGVGTSFHISGIDADSTVSSFELRPTDFKPTGVAITVYAKGNGSSSIDSDPSEGITVFKLATPSNLTFNDDVVMWDSVDNAQNYRVMRGSDTLYNGSGVNSTSFSTELLSIGSNTIRVHAYRSVINIATNYYVDSDYAQIAISKLAAPEVAIDASAGKLTWGFVVGCSGYEVRFDELTRNINNNNTTEFLLSDFALEAKTYSVKIRARGGTDAVASSYVTFDQVVQRLTQPTLAVEYTDQKIRATATDTSGNAAGYRFTLGGTVRQVQSSNVFVSETITAVGEHTVSVVAVGQVFAGTTLGTSIYYLDSNTAGAPQKTITIHSKPLNLTITKQGETSTYLIKWDHDSSFYSSAYKIVITVGGMIVEDATITSLEHTVTATAGQQIEVSVKSAGNGTTTFDSKAITASRIA